MRSRVPAHIPSTLMLLPDDIWVHTLMFLPAANLAVCLRVNKTIFTLANTDRLWRQLVFSHREGRLLETHPSISSVGAGQWRQAFATDRREVLRIHLQAEELCRLQWLFRFKRAASWGDEEPCRAVFTPDGFLKRFNMRGEPQNEEMVIRWR
jgi:hypothetical protein